MLDSRLVVPVGPDDHVRGPDDASVTLVEYGDFECSYCGQAFRAVRELERTFAQQLRFVFRNLPLTQIHPHAQHAAEAAEAVALQGKFWAMHDLLFEHQRDLSDGALLHYSPLAGADAVKVAEALKAGTARAKVEADIASGTRSGVSGTPTFFVNDVRYDGSWSAPPFAEYLQGVMGEPG